MTRRRKKPFSMQENYDMKTFYSLFFASVFIDLNEQKLLKMLNYLDYIASIDKYRTETREKQLGQAIITFVQIYCK